METKICHVCREELPATTEFFIKGKTWKGGLRTQCKNCDREYRQKNKDKIRKYMENYRKTHKEESRERHTKYMRKYRKNDGGRHNFLTLIHWHINKRKPKQENCTICNEVKKTELANISGKYEKDINDLCGYVVHAIFYSIR